MIKVTEINKFETVRKLRFRVVFELTTPSINDYADIDDKF